MSGKSPKLCPFTEISCPFCFCIPLTHNYFLECKALTAILFCVHLCLSDQVLGGQVARQLSLSLNTQLASYIDKGVYFYSVSHSLQLDVYTRSMSCFIFGNNSFRHKIQVQLATNLLENCKHAKYCLMVWQRYSQLIETAHIILH